MDAHHITSNSHPHAAPEAAMRCFIGAADSRSSLSFSLSSAHVTSPLLDGTPTFTFLSVFRWEDKKNWRGLLSAFYEGRISCHVTWTACDMTMP